MIEIELIDRRNCILASLVIASFLFCYAGVIASFVKAWKADTYSFGYFIPLISIYILWTRREKLRNLRFRPSYLIGVPVLILALLALRIGEIGGMLIMRNVSFLIAIIGLVLYLFGVEIFRVVWFPVVYLIFMIPLWDLLFEALYFPFQLIAAEIGVQFLKLAGIPSYHSGVYIELPNITLHVAKVCSGVNYLLSVIALGIPLAYLYLEKTLKRLIVLSSAVLIAIISNGIRISLIAIFSYYGYRDIHGPFGIFRAVLISVLGYIALFMLVLMLSDRKDRGETRSEEQGAKSKDSPVMDREKHKLRCAPALLVSICFVSVAMFVPAMVSEPILLRSDFNTFPNNVGEWKGSDIPKQFDVFDKLGADRQLSRRYVSESGESVDLYIGYFEYQKQGKELINQKMMGLIRNSSKLTIQTGSGEKLSVIKSIRDDVNDNKRGYIWFDINGRILTNKYLVKLYTTWDMIFHNRTNGSVVIVTADPGEGIGKNTRDQSVINFIETIYPIVNSHLPGLPG